MIELQKMKQRLNLLKTLYDNLKEYSFSHKGRQIGLPSKYSTECLSCLKIRIDELTLAIKNLEEND